MKKFTIIFLILTLFSLPAFADILSNLTPGAYIVVSIDGRDPTPSSCISVFESGNFIAAYSIGEQFTLETGQVVAEHNATVAKCIEPTTTEIITFRDVPWLSDRTTALDAVMKAFPEITDKEENNTTWSFCDPEGRYFPKYIASEVDAISYSLTRPSYSATARVTTRTNFGTVAGYPIDCIYLHFADTDLSNARNLGLYEATYSFDSLPEIPVFDQYLDLDKKLSKLYGEPYRYTRALDDLDTIYTYSVWIGADGTGAYLDYSINVSTSDFLAGMELLSLSYGTTRINPTFIDAIEKQEAHAAAEAEAIERRRQEVFSDNSGL